MEDFLPSKFGLSVYLHCTDHRHYTHCHWRPCKDLEEGTTTRKRRQFSTKNPPDTGPQGMNSDPCVANHIAPTGCLCFERMRLTENIYQRKWPSCYDLSIRVDIQRVYAYMHIILWNNLIARINYIQISILSKITGLYIISPGLKQVEIHIHVAVLHMHLSTFGMLTLIMKKNYWNAGDLNMYKHKRELLVRKMHAL